MKGTSMATPHVAGVAALVKEYLLQHYPDLTPAQNADLVKALIMSTAKLHVNKETGVYTLSASAGSWYRGYGSGYFYRSLCDRG